MDTIKTLNQYKETALLKKFIKKRNNSIPYIEDAVSHQFVLFTNSEDIQEYGEKDALQTLSCDLNNEGSVAWQVARFLNSEGFSLNSVRELARETRVSFSLIDDTPGSEADFIVLHVRVDITNKRRSDQDSMRLLPLSDYAAWLEDTLFCDRVLDLGIAQLCAEQGKQK